MSSAEHMRKLREERKAAGCCPYCAQKLQRRSTDKTTGKNWINRLFNR